MIRTANGSRVESVEWYSVATLLACVVVDREDGRRRVIVPAANLEADGGLREVISAAKEMRHCQQAPAGRPTA